MRKLLIVVIWFAIGDKFKPGDILLEIETDKASIDIEAQDDGVMAKIFVYSHLILVGPGIKALTALIGR